MSRRFVKQKSKKPKPESKLNAVRIKLRKFRWVVTAIGVFLAIVGLVGIPYINDNYIHRITISPKQIKLYGSDFTTISTFSISNNSGQMLYSIEAQILLNNCSPGFTEYSIEPINPNDELAVTIGGADGGIVWNYNYMILGGITLDQVPFIQLHINSLPPKTTEMFQVKFGKGAESINGENVTASLNISSYSLAATPIFGQ